MSRKLICSLLLAVACFGVVNSIPGIVSTALACDTASDCYTVPSNGPVLACDSDSGRGCG